MQFYDIVFMLNSEQSERLAQLAEQLRGINNWDETGLLQFVVTATESEDVINAKLDFAENLIRSLKENETA